MAQRAAATMVVSEQAAAAMVAAVRSEVESPVAVTEMPAMAMAVEWVARLAAWVVNAQPGQHLSR